MKGKVLITDNAHPLLEEGLRADGFEVDYLPHINPDEVAHVIADYEGLIVNSKIYAGKELITKGVKLKFIGRLGSGLEVIDVPFATGRGIFAFNSPEGNRNAVAEHALGMLLSMMNNIATANAQVKNHEWRREENRGTELSGKTVGLIAYGNTGQAFARLLQPFDVTVLAYDKYVNDFGNEYVTESTLEEIANRADVLSLHLPLTDETRYIVNYNYLASFKRPFWLINTSRGKVLRTVDVLRAMQEGKLLGAALDVLENEQINKLSAEEQEWFNALVADKRVLLTPHIAGWTYESLRKIAETVLLKIRECYNRE